MGAVRKVPSATKGKRAHPHKIEKLIFERINRKEYIRALESAVAGTADAGLILASHSYPKKELPIVVSSSIEKVSKTKDLLKILGALEFASDLEKSHVPRLKHGLRRKAKKRYFRSSVLIVAKDDASLSKAGRNIPGVDVACVDRLSIGLLAPGAKPRLTLWTESAVESVEKSVASTKQVKGVR
jgi:large subunit ribosomal protein L4e